MHTRTPDRPGSAAAGTPVERVASNGGIVFIAVFDLVKAVLFLVAAFGVFTWWIAIPAWN